MMCKDINVRTSVRKKNATFIIIIIKMTVATFGHDTIEYSTEQKMKGEVGRVSIRGAIYQFVLNLSNRGVICQFGVQSVNSWCNLSIRGAICQFLMY